MSPRTRTLLLVALGVGVGCYGWFDVRRRARTDRGPRFHRTDFTVYQAAAEALSKGDDAYEATNPRGYRYVYPPFFATLLVPVAHWKAPDAALLFFAVSMLALFASFFLLRRLPRVGGGTWGWPAVVVGVVLCLGFLHQSFQRGQVTILLLAMQVAAMAAVARGRWFTGALLLTLAGAVRLTPFLLVGAVGIGLLAAGPKQGWGRAGRFATGGVVGLLLAFVAVPVLVLGAQDARAATTSWWASTTKLYGSGAADADLLRDYSINEHRFKNQAPRRVFTTWAGWATDAPFDRREKPTLAAPAQKTAHAAAWGVGLCALALAVFLAVRAFALRDPARWLTALAWIGLLPVLVTRYTWPTHFVVALPALALVAAQGRRRDRVCLGVFLLGTALFYAAHAKALQPVGAAGPLLLATVVVLVVQLSRRKAATP